MGWVVRKRQGMSEGVRGREDAFRRLLRDNEVRDNGGSR